MGITQIFHTFTGQGLHELTIWNRSRSRCAASCELDPHGTVNHRGEEDEEREGADCFCQVDGFWRRLKEN